jgi:hypothetical protein
MVLSTVHYCDVSSGYTCFITQQQSNPQQIMKRARRTPRWREPEAGGDSSEAAPSETGADHKDEKDEESKLEDKEPAQRRRRVGDERGAPDAHRTGGGTGGTGGTATAASTEEEAAAVEPWIAFFGGHDEDPVRRYGNRDSSGMYSQRVPGLACWFENHTEECEARLRDCIEAHLGSEDARYDLKLESLSVLSLPADLARLSRIRELIMRKNSLRQWPSRFPPRITVLDIGSAQDVFNEETPPIDALDTGILVEVSVQVKSVRDVMFIAEGLATSTAFRLLSVHASANEGAEPYLEFGRALVESLKTNRSLIDFDRSLCGQTLFAQDDEVRAVDRAIEKAIARNRDRLLR